MASVDFHWQQFCNEIPKGHEDRFKRIQDALIELEADLLMAIPESSPEAKYLLEPALDALKNVAWNAYNAAINYADLVEQRKGEPHGA